MEDWAAGQQEVLVDGEGVPRWAATGKEVLLEPGRRYWCLWAHDRKLLFEALSPPVRKGGKQKRPRAVDWARRNGLFSFVVEPTPLDTASASQLFPIETNPEQGESLDQTEKRDIQERMRYAVAALIHNTRDGQGYVSSRDVKAADVKGRSGDVSGKRAWLFARRPAIATTYLVEFLKHQIVAIKAESAWAHDHMALMAGMVEASEKGAQLEEWDLAAMRSLARKYLDYVFALEAELGRRASYEEDGRAGAPTPENEARLERGRKPVRWNLRQALPAYLRYARRCAAARRIACPRSGERARYPLGERCTTDRFAKTIPDESSLDNCEEARREFQQEFGVEPPSDPLLKLIRRTTRDYANLVKDYFEFYQYHLLVKEQASKSRHGWLAQRATAKVSIEEQASRICELACAHLDRDAPLDRFWKDVALHELPDTRDDPKLYGDRASRIHLRFFSVTPFMGRRWWLDLEKSDDLAEVALEAFDNFGKMGSS